MEWAYPTAFRRSVECSPLLGCGPSTTTRTSMLSSTCTSTDDACYSNGWKGAETGDLFGTSVALMRSGDENAALVVGIPGERVDRVGTGVGEGAVGIYGSLHTAGQRFRWRIPTHAPNELVSVQSFTDSHLGLDGAATTQGPRAGDLFGFATTAGRLGRPRGRTNASFTATAQDALAISAPLRPSAGGATGRVYVTGHYRAKAKSIPWLTVEPLPPPTFPTPQLFGISLATGDLDASSTLAGAGDQQQPANEELIIGAPWTPRKGAGSEPVQGAVYVWDPDTQAIEWVVELPSILQPETASSFGWAVESGDLSGSGQDDLVVGAPTLYSFGGAFIFAWNQPTNQFDLRGRIQSSPFIDDRMFGASLAISEPTPHDVLFGQAQRSPILAVGAPGNDDTRGAVIFYQESVTTPGGYVELGRMLADDWPGVTSAAGDEFGAAIEFIPFAGAPDSSIEYSLVAIGSPGATRDGVSGNGAVFIVRLEWNVGDGLIEGLTIVPHDHFDQSTRPISACTQGLDHTYLCPGLAGLTDGAGFGTSLAATGTLLAVGAPGAQAGLLDGVDSGEVYTYLRLTDEADYTLMFAEDGDLADRFYPAHSYNETSHGPVNSFAE